jgi:multiple sugar transport system substrate-binding protein
MRRSRLAPILATVLIVAGCDGGGSDSGGPTAARGPITIWFSDNPAEIAWGEQMVAAWNGAHPEETITAQELPSAASPEQAITLAIEGGSTPCLIFHTAPAAVPGFQGRGGLVPLDSFGDGRPYLEQRTGPVAEQYQSPDGQYYQLPWKSNPVMVFYNRELFEEAGLDPEDPPLSSYDEFLDTARTLVDSGAAEVAVWSAPAGEFFPSWFDFYPLFAAETGGWQLLEGGEATFDSDPGRVVAEFWRTLYAEELAGPERYEGDAFADGVVAMRLGGPTAVPAYEGIDWGVAPVPTSTGVPADQVWTFSDARSVAMYTTCENQATAWDVVKFATSPEQDGLFLELTGQMPMRPDLPATYPDYVSQGPAYLAFADQAARTAEVPNVPHSLQVWQAFQDTWTASVIAGEQDPAAALADVAGEINGLVRGG